jgi:hypothetical protein
MMASSRDAFGEAGSTLPELLTASALLLVALTMLSGTVITPLLAIAGAYQRDERQAEFDRAVDVVAGIVRDARPGIDGSAVLVARPDELVVRTGDLRTSLEVRILLDAGRLTIEQQGSSSDGVIELSSRVLIAGLDTERSRFTVLTAEGHDLTADADAISSTWADGPAAAQAATIIVVLAEAADPDGVDDADGSRARSVERVTHLRLRAPLSAGG